MDYCYEKEESAPGSASIGVVVTAAATPANPAIQIAAARRARLNSLLGLDVDDAPTAVVGSLEVGHTAQPESQVESAVLPSCMHVASRPRPIHVVSARVSRSPGFPSLGPSRATRIFVPGTMAGRRAPPPAAGAGRGAPPPPARQLPPTKHVVTIAAGLAAALLQ